MRFRGLERVYSLELFQSRQASGFEALISKGSCLVSLGTQRRGHPRNGEMSHVCADTGYSLLLTLDSDVSITIDEEDSFIPRPHRILLSR